MRTEFVCALYIAAMGKTYKHQSLKALFYFLSFLKWESIGQGVKCSWHVKTALKIGEIGALRSLKHL